MALDSLPPLEEKVPEAGEWDVPIDVEVEPATDLMIKLGIKAAPDVEL